MDEYDDTACKQIIKAISVKLRMQNSQFCIFAITPVCTPRLWRLAIAVSLVIRAWPKSCGSELRPSISENTRNHGNRKSHTVILEMGIRSSGRCG